jgi:outer membrane protein assembly factor BamB
MTQIGWFERSREGTRKFFCPTLAVMMEDMLMKTKGLVGVMILTWLALTVDLAEAGTPGQQKWAVSLNTMVVSSPALAPDGTVYVGGVYNSYLFAFKPDGNPKWSFPTTGSIYSSPAIGRGGTIYVFDSYGYLYALTDNGTSATQKWVTTAGWSTYCCSPAIGRDGTIYIIGIGSDGSKLYAFTDNGTSATQKWTSDPMGNWTINSSPVIAPNGTIYVGSEDTKIYAFRDNGTSVTQKWTFTTGSSIRGSAAIGPDGTVYIGSGDHRLYALKDNGTSVTQKWAFTTGASISSSPAIGPDGTIYVGSDDKKLYALTDNGASVTQKWAYGSTGTYLRSSPAIGADGVIYLGSNDAYALYAINPNGTHKWRFNLGYTPDPDDSTVVYSSPVVGPDGTVYVGTLASYDYNNFLGKLFAVFGDSPGLAKTSWPMFRHDATHTGRAPLKFSPAAISLLIMDE